MKDGYLTIGAQLKAKGQNILKKQVAQQTEPKKDFFSYVNNKNRKKIREMILNGADVNAKDKDGWTALMLATDNKDFKTVELLLKLGADIDLQNDEGQTALMIAALIDEKDIGNFLILSGANIDITDNWKQNAIEIAEDAWNEKKSDYFLSSKQLKRIMKNRICYFICETISKKQIGEEIIISDIKKDFKEIYNSELEDEDIDVGIDYINNQIIGKDFQLEKKEGVISIEEFYHKKESFRLDKNTTENQNLGIHIWSDENYYQNKDPETLLKMGKFYYEQGDYDEAEFFLEKAAIKKNSEAEELLKKLYLNQLENKYEFRQSNGIHGRTPPNTNAWSKYLKVRFIF